MRSDDAASPLDRDEFGDANDLLGLDAPDVESLDRRVSSPDEPEAAGDVEVDVEVDPDADPDAVEALLEAELGLQDAPLDDVEDIDEMLIDTPDDDEDEDDAEVVLLQELGIDLDMTDDVALDGVILDDHGLHEEETVDDEVAA